MEPQNLLRPDGTWGFGKYLYTGSPEYVWQDFGSASAYNKHLLLEVADSFKNNAYRLGRDIGLALSDVATDIENLLGAAAVVSFDAGAAGRGDPEAVYRLAHRVETTGSKLSKVRARDVPMLLLKQPAQAFEDLILHDDVRGMAHLVISNAVGARLTPTTAFASKGFAPLAEHAAESGPLVGPLREGVNHEIERLAELGVPKNNVVWRPTQADMDSAAFKTIVGDPKFTASGLPKGTIFDGTLGGNLEIKGGSSMLDSSYQLRVQTYRSLKTNTPLTIETTRPINPAFQQWLDRWGVSVVRPK